MDADFETICRKFHVQHSYNAAVQHLNITLPAIRLQYLSVNWNCFYCCLYCLSVSLLYVTFYVYIFMGLVAWFQKWIKK